MNGRGLIALAMLLGAVVTGCPCGRQDDPQQSGFASNGSDRQKLKVAPVRIDVDSSGISIEDFRLSTRTDYSGVSRKVLAFYYPWFGTPTGASGCGHWRHWRHGGPEPTPENICISTRCPLWGPYDSHDRETIDRHCRWAKMAGIDGWIITWFGEEIEDRALPGILDGCRRHQLTACIQYEGDPDLEDPRQMTPENTADQIVRALDKYARHPAYLKVHGRPVVFIYARPIDQLGLTRWLRTTARINRHYRGGIVLIGDQFSQQAARSFDGLYGYIPAPDLVGLTPKEARRWAEVSYDKWVHLADRRRRISTLTVIPGYNDTLIRDPGFTVERYGGRLYRALWEAAIRADPHWILIATFNEWSEGSEIEPSREEGKPYLDLTAKYAKRFKATRRAVRQPAPSALSDEQLTALRRRVEKLKVAVLPGAESEAIWWLVNRLQVEPELVSWAEVIGGALAPDRFGLLLYAGGEHYRQTLRQKGDVDTAIRRYLNARGFLAILPGEPLPFFYDQDGKPVNSAKQFGLTLGNACDKPPAGKLLHFVQPGQTLAHVPRRLAFPTAGDLRWRPITHDKHRRHVSLLKLCDDGGGFYGDAAAYAELPGGGRILYAWFRLLDSPYADELLYDLFEFIADHAEIDSSP